MSFLICLDTVITADGRVIGVITAITIIGEVHGITVLSAIATRGIITAGVQTLGIGMTTTGTGTITITTTGTILTGATVHGIRHTTGHTGRLTMVRETVHRIMVLHTPDQLRLEDAITHAQSLQADPELPYLPEGGLHHTVILHHQEATPEEAAPPTTEEVHAVHPLHTEHLQIQETRHTIRHPHQEDTPEEAALLTAEDGAVHQARTEAAEQHLPAGEDRTDRTKDSNYDK